MKQRPRKTGPYDPQRITRAVTFIRLESANGGKLAALDDLAQVYLALYQQYVSGTQQAHVVTVGFINDEGQVHSYAFVLRRCQILLASARGEAIPHIA